MTIDGATSVVNVTSATVTGNVTAANMSVTTGNVTLGNLPMADGVGNIGESGLAFNTVHAKATSAQYADMAERFHADAEYAPGTIVELGGVNEVTLCVEELSDKVFGVVSTQPAYLMNGNRRIKCYTSTNCMSGRVPVKRNGICYKGDRLVSAGNGTARAANLDEITSFNVIGSSTRKQNRRRNW